MARHGRLLARGSGRPRAPPRTRHGSAWPGAGATARPIAAQAAPRSSPGAVAGQAPVDRIDAIAVALERLREQEALAEVGAERPELGQLAGLLDPLGDGLEVERVAQLAGSSA